MYAAAMLRETPDTKISIKSLNNDLLLFLSSNEQLILLAKACSSVSIDFQVAFHRSNRADQYAEKRRYSANSCKK